ncbi:hypothetical protein SPWS13_2617 [Shewanella putrefaciens]|nr:hypothetical protein SPWS13_2617 [Shewanella putrefaciens]
MAIFPQLRYYRPSGNMGVSKVMASSWLNSKKNLAVASSFGNFGFV